MPFTKADPKQKYIKMGIYGPPGSGKTFTTLLYTEILAKETGKRVAFVDTERGTDFYVHENKKREFHPEAFDFDAIYTRSLLEVDSEVRSLDFETYGVIVIDSISHLWDAAIAAYEGKMNSNESIPMQAWGKIKKPYKSLVQFLMDAPAHVFILGRQKNIFDNSTEGELRKVGVGMRAEGETAYEPHICCRMEGKQNEKDSTKTTYFALFEKDRTGVLSGRTFPNPTAKIIESLLPCLDGAEQAKSQDLDEVASLDSALLDKDEDRKLDKAGKSRRDLTDFTARITASCSLDDLDAVGKDIKKRKRYMMPEHLNSLKDVYELTKETLTNKLAGAI